MVWPRAAGAFLSQAHNYPVVDAARLIASPRKFIWKMVA
jgi:hypothetical protein